MSSSTNRSAPDDSHQPEQETKRDRRNAIVMIGIVVLLLGLLVVIELIR